MSHEQTNKQASKPFEEESSLDIGFRHPDLRWLTEFSGKPLAKPQAFCRKPTSVVSVACPLAIWPK